jgi:hypothetical protein
MQVENRKISDLTPDDKSARAGSIDGSARPLHLFSHSG